MKPILIITLFLFSLLSHAQDEKCLKKGEVTTVTVQEDIWYCLGREHVQHKKELLDFFLVVSQGKAAEFYGKNWIESDFFLRIIDLETLANKIVSEIAPETKKMLESYRDGINSLYPNYWSSQKTILVLLLQSLDQTKQGFSNEIKEQKFINKFGGPLTLAPWETSILDKIQPRSPKTTQYKTLNFPQVESTFLNEIGLSAGSNNWAVAKEKSKNGKALLANDPHLSLTKPAFWYWANIKSPQLSLQGATLPGSPLFAAGTNGQVSWGLTNSYLDTGEVYLLPEHELKSFQTITPIVWVKFGRIKLPIFFKRFQVTPHLNILPFEAPKGFAYVLRWSGKYLTGKDLDPIFSIAFAQNIDQFNERLKKVGLPSWNYVFAGKNGDIGFRAVGKIAKRTNDHHQGLWPTTFKAIAAEPEWINENEMPHNLRPKSGFVFSANNRHVMDGRYGYAFSSSLRAKRIKNFLEAHSKISQAEMAALQCDVLGLEPMYLLPLLYTHTKREDVGEFFKQWDFKFSKNCVECGVYKYWIKEIMKELNIDKEPRYPEYLYSALQYKGKELQSMLSKTFDLALKLKDKKWIEIHQASFPYTWDEPSQSPIIPVVGDTHTVNMMNSIWKSKHFEAETGPSMRMLVEMTASPQTWATLVETKDWQECVLRKRPEMF